MTEIGSLHRLLELGRGGMARVWLAVSTGASGFRKLVVVKQLRPEMADNERARSMFLDEARLAAKLNHPNTVQTLEVAEQGDELFIVMEYLDGQPLDSLQRQGPVPLEALVAVLIEVCAGLHHAHELRDLDGTELGVVHRDISPQNVFVTYTGHVKVVDFGIAKAAGSSSESRAGEIKGKILYMSPEQALGMSVDRRADIFSVGVMLYTALSGRRLWEGVPENEVLERLRLGNVPGLVPRPGGLSTPPAELVEICNRCLMPAARDRFSTALELQSALEDFATDSGGVLSRRELGAFISRSFESQRARRRAVIEEKVRALTEGGLIADSVKRSRSIIPEEQSRSSRPTTAGPGRTPPPFRRRSGEMAAANSARQPSSELIASSPTSGTSSTDQMGITDDMSRSSRPAAGAWRMPQPYKLLTRLSRPGLIFQARDRTTQCPVTVQLLKGSLSNEQLAARYAKVAQLQHPNTVRLLDVGSVKQPVAVTYLVRESVEGQSLTKLLEQDGTLEPTRAFRICVEVLRSLRHAHERGVIHGRLRPDHILLQTSVAPRAEVAKVLGYWPSNVTVRREQDEMFHPPEEREGKATARTDLYAVAATLCCCIVGAPPKDGVAPRTGRQDVDEFLHRALSAQVIDRYPDADAMLKAVQGLDWGADVNQYQRHRYLFGAAAPLTAARLVPARNELLSTRRVSVWVLEGDPSFLAPAVTEGLALIGAQAEVRHLGEADRELAMDELISGRVSPPWVVMFGAIHALVQEPLLRLLATSAEVSRLLVLGGDNFELMQQSINEVGLDGYLSHPQKASEVVESVDRLVARTKQLTAHYDGVRSELRRSRDELSQCSREFAAAGESNSLR